MTKNDEYMNNSRSVDIEEFINKFKCCNNKLDDYDVGTIEILFDSGYCYSFALILKHVFPKDTIGHVNTWYPKINVDVDDESKSVTLYGKAI